MAWVLRFLAFLLGLLRKILQPFYRCRDGVRKPCIPPNDNPLLRLTACELARKIRLGETMINVFHCNDTNYLISSETVVKVYIDRIKEVNPILNAVIEDRYEAALNDARQCDKKLNSGEVAKAHLEVKMPLYGVPFTVKESCSLKGLSHTGCSLLRQGIKATADSPIVTSLKSAGAIPLCVTNTPELCSGFDSANLLFGRSTNPYDRRRTPGGSSGGEGALLGAGASLIGIGSDIGGSIRIPALFNGIFGHKPTPGIIPITEHYPNSDCKIFNKYLVVGPLARYMDDLTLAMRVMCGEHGKDLRLDETIDIRKLRIFYREDAGPGFGVESVDPAIKRSIKSAANHFKTCGARVSDAPLGSLRDTLEITVTALLTVSKLPPILINPADPKNECDGVIELIKGLFGMSNYTKSAALMAIITNFKGFISKAERERALIAAEALREKFLVMLGDDGVFFYPTFTNPAPVVGEVTLQYPAGMYCTLVNILGLPATHVPMGLNEKGLPIGFQVIAGPNQDRLCLAVAKELEKQFGGWVAPPTC